MSSHRFLALPTFIIIRGPKSQQVGMFGSLCFGVTCQACYVLPMAGHRLICPIKVWIMVCDLECDLAGMS